MLMEVAQPICLLFCLLSLLQVFHTAFLAPATSWGERSFTSLELLALSAGICLASGLVFRDLGTGEKAGKRPLGSTLPVQLFCWATCLMVVLFVAAWYLETHGIFYRDSRRL